MKIVEDENGRVINYIAHPNQNLTMPNNEPLSTLSPTQRQAVEKCQGPLLVLAGAGSGKTRVLTARITYLLSQKHCLPENILAVTFTNKAAKEMKERLAMSLGKAVVDAMCVSTFHSLGLRILRESGKWMGLSEQFTIIDSDDQLSLIKRIIRNFTRGYKNEKPEDMAAKISLAKNRRFNPETFLLKYPEDRKTARVFDAYQKALKKTQCVDFDDLLLHPLELFTKHPEILELYRNRWKFLSIDEFQDTNAAQIELAQLLAAPDNNIMAVGDDDQSIYSWRGAEIQNILSFASRFPNAETVILKENYRSSSQILSGALAVVEHNGMRKAKELVAVQGAGRKLQHYAGDDEEDECEWLAQTLRQDHKENRFRYGQAALLFRTNTETRRFEEALRRNGIPYVVTGAMSFFERKEVKDLMGYLRFFNNPQDELALARVLKVPNKGIFPATLEKVENLAAGRNCSLWEALLHWKIIPDINEAQGNAIQKLCDYHSQYDSAFQQGLLSHTLRSAIEHCGYMKNLRDQQEADGRNPRLDVAEEFFRGLEQFEHRNRKKKATLTQFLQELALNASRQEDEDENGKLERVQLMTIHRSKGLEFPIVYLAGLDNDHFPSPKTVAEGGICEERRLFYVAMTRAKEELVCTWPRTKLFHKKMRDVSPSTFLFEIPAELWEHPLGQKQVEDRHEYLTDFFSGLREQLNGTD